MGIENFIQLFESHTQGSSKPFFLDPDHFADEIPLSFEFGVGAVHFGDDEIADFVEEEVAQAQMFAAVVDGATHYFAEDVVAAFVAGQDAVGDGKRGRTRVVGDHA